MQKQSGQTLFLWGSIVLSVGLVGYVLYSTRDSAGGGPNDNTTNVSARSQLTLEDIPFDGERAYEMLEAICDLGRRPSGSPGMEAQQELLREHFTNLGGVVDMQRFRSRHPETGAEVQMANMIVSWHPESTERVLLCAHYDTLPYPNRDPDPARRRGTFIGANDGASGVAVLAELAHHMADLESNYGVDFVLFDAEEFNFHPEPPIEEFFKGSRFFANDYVQNPPPYTYRWGVLLDMVGDKNLELRQERFSMRWRDTRPLVNDIWRTAADLEVTEFVDRLGFEVRDDHLPLHNIGGIPTCDIIDFEYGPPGTRQSYWHTEADTPDKCSALSLAKVGWVLHQWLERTE